MRFRELGEEQLQRLYALPTIFAYENGMERDARLGRVHRIRIQNRQVQIEYELAPEAAPIPHALLTQEARALDIGDWELNRTHWAIKDVDPFPILTRHGLIRAGLPANVPANQQFERMPGPAEILIRPAVFRIPQEPIDPHLVAVMMPFRPEFDEMLRHVSDTCQGLGLVCRNVGHIWENNEIVQDVFSLIYRSRIVVCDFTSQNANVFYEAGIAHTLGKHLIPIAQSIDDLPFDLRHHRARVYTNDPAGLAQLANVLRSRIQWLIEHD